MADAIFDERLLPSTGLAALPWLNVENSLGRILGGGAFTGVGPHTDRADMLRALAAALAFEMARVLREVKRHRRVNSVVLGGGASEGDVLTAALVVALGRAFYETRLRDFLPDRLIDIHTHVWLESIRGDRMDRDDRTVTWPARVAPENPIEDLLETYRLMLPSDDFEASMSLEALQVDGIQKGAAAADTWATATTAKATAAPWTDTWRPIPSRSSCPPTIRRRSGSAGACASSACCGSECTQRLEEGT